MRGLQRFFAFFNAKQESRFKRDVNEEYRAGFIEGFKSARQDFGLDDSGFTAFCVDDTKERDRTKSFTYVSLSRRSVVLLSASCELPERMSMAVDLIEPLPSPTPAHLLDAARRHGITEMTSSDARYLSEIHFGNISAVLTFGRPYRAAIRRLRAGMRDPVAATPAPKAEAASTALEDLVGVDEVREWGLSLARDIALWKNGKLPWSEVDRGALLSGPPGTGKTMLASMLAAACGLNFVPTSAAKWQAHGHLGDYLKAMRAAFAQAVTQAPAVLFIDQADSIDEQSRA
ncbi:AAA family ATPase [Rhizobium sp.]